MPTHHSHTITHGLLIFNGVRECFAFAKSHQPTRKPKLGGSVCLSHRTPNRQGKNTKNLQRNYRDYKIVPFRATYNQYETAYASYFID